tara:strand:+ start:49 stop:360 length:312 start_codon:yes stop_codon:yes gene_type:complete
MSSKEESTVKITKSNLTKHVIESFLSEIDYSKQYNAKTLRNMIDNAYKVTKEKIVAPKKAPSEYNLFVKEKNKELKLENPEMNNTEIFKKTAELWNEYKKTKA